MSAERQTGSAKAIGEKAEVTNTDKAFGQHVQKEPTQELGGILCCPICRARIAKYGHFPRILDKGWRNFSAVQTYWRRAKDSNRQYNSGIYRRIKLDSQMLRFVIANHSPKVFRAEVRFFRIQYKDG